MATLKNTTIDSTGFINLPSGTTAQRPGSPAAGQIRYNTDINDTEYYDGAAWRPISDSNPEATGGTIVDTDIGGVPYRIHYFTNTGNTTFTVTKGGEVEYLIVAGGGGGGGYVAAAGGGGGGVLTGISTVSAQNYTITVGAGGSAGPVNRSSNGGNGGNSSAFGLTAIGGGGGGRGWSLAAGNSGGSAGGTGGGDGIGGAAFLAGVAGTAGQGNAGGGGRRCSQNSGTAGGGGGAGSAGTTPICSPRSAGRGGQGILSSITGTNNFYAGGGGSDSYSPVIREVGGIGGGGNSNGSSGSKNGAQNTGGGAGSAGNLSGNGGVGGSGIVVIRYPRNSSTTTAPDETRPSFQPYNYARDVRPIIARDGLVLDLDAANPVSYPGSGTTWTDLSGNGNDAVISLGSPDFVTDFNGSFKFSLGSEDRFAVSASNDFDISSGNFTIELWLRMSTAGDSTNTYYGILAVGDTEGDLSSTYIRQWRSGIYPGSIYSRINNTIGLGYDSSIDVNISGEGWYQIIMRENNGTWQYLFNGNIIESVATPSYPSSGAKWITLGKDVSLQSFDGEIGALRFYQRSLSDAEIQQNFNALRGRYGI